MNPRAAIEAAFAAYRATAGQPVHVQEAARKRYDAAVRAHEARYPCVGIEGTRERMRNARDAGRVKRQPVKRDEWGYPVDE